MKLELAVDAAISDEEEIVGSAESTNGGSDKGRNSETAEEQIRAQIKDQVTAGVKAENKRTRRKGHRAKAAVNKKERLKKFERLVRGGEASDAKWIKGECMGKYAFDHSDRSWYEYDKHSWSLDKTGVSFSILNTYKRYLVKEYSAVEDAMSSPGFNREKLDKAYTAKLKRLEELNYGKRVLEYAAQGRNSLGIDGSQWDENPNLLGFENGVLDLDTLEFRDGRPDDYIRDVIPHKWLGIETPAPVWETFLDTCLPADPNDASKGGNKDVICYLQKLFGVALSGKAKERMLPVLIGEGQNGKGTAIETIGYIFEALSCPVDAEMLMEQSFSRSSSAPSADKMALRGKRFVWASESNEGRKLDSGKVKALTGGDTITARAPYGKFQVTFPPTHQLFLITNHAPVMDPDDRALWYRVSFIYFPLSFVENPKAIYERQRDKDLLHKLRGEASGIIAWVVRGYKAYIDEGMEIPESVQVTTSEYRDANDHIGLFVSECLEKSKAGKVAYKAAYKAYCEWAEESKLRPMARPIFKSKIAAKIGEFKREGKGYYYKGYELIKVR